MKSVTALSAALLMLCAGPALATGNVLSNGRITIDMADPALGNATDSERIDSIVWVKSNGTSTANLAASQSSFGCGEPHEFFGQSYGDSEGQGPYLVIAGTQSSWTGNSLGGVAVTNPAASNCYYAPYLENVSHLDGVTTTQYSLGTTPGLINTLHIQRSFAFASGALSHDIRAYVGRLHYATYNTVIIPNASGALQYYSATSCGTACEITNWNGKWFADDDGNGNGMAVIRDPHSTWPAVVAIDTDAGSASNLTSVALKVPAGGWSGTVTESEYVCFYDLTSWPAASRSAGELPTGCQVYGAYASKIVYSFAGSPTLRSADGANPSAELVADKTGAFYGVTLAGGANLCKSTATKHESCGTIFKLTPPATTGGAWTESVVFNFQQKDGWAPLGRFRISDGLIYGTTYYGGTGCQPAGCGVVYSVDQRGPGQPALEKVLHAFVLTTDGHNPNPRLVADSTGAMYGSTLSGGAYNAGIIFKMTPPAVKGQAWGYADIYDFTGGADGGTPNDFTLATNGTIYGTTQAGGANLQGIAYELAPPATAGGAWTLTDLHDFAGGADGATPMAGTVQDAGGAIYGTTAQGGGTGCGGAGCGTVFVLTPTAGGFAESVVYAFTGAPDGATPTAPLIGTSPGPVLYGTTSAGGAGSGTVFQLTPPAVTGGTWTETIIDSFAGKPDGAGPDGRLYVDKSGVLYGTTLTGGASGAGAIYQLTP